MVSPDYADVLTAIELSSRGEPGYLRFPLLADRRVTPRLASDAAESLRIMQDYPRALGQLEEVSHRCRNPLSGRPGAAELAAHLFMLTTHSRLTRAGRRRIRKLLESTSRRPSSRTATASPVSA